MSEARQQVGIESLLELLRSRRSLKPRWLAPPAPARAEIERFVEAALTAPDHGNLQPWRFVLIEPSSFPRLAKAFAEAALEVDPCADADAIRTAREKALDSPAVVALIAVTDPAHAFIPSSEQLISVGAALQSFLLAVHAAGFGGIILSGKRVSTSALRRAFSLAAHEQLVGFISIGTPAGEPKPRQRPSIEDCLQIW